MSLISDYDVVVIGAGAAGLSASAELMRRGISFVCIEGMNRIGGRCYTDMSTFGVPADHGAHWLHGHKQNEIAIFGKKHKDKFKIYKEPDRSVVYDGGKKVNENKDSVAFSIFPSDISDVIKIADKKLRVYRK